MCVLRSSYYVSSLNLVLQDTYGDTSVLYKVKTFITVILLKPRSHCPGLRCRFIPVR